MRSIVGRYLEHSRIFEFANGAGPQRTLHYIGSADWMPRNLDRRVEALTPVDDPRLQARLEEVLDVNLADDVLAWSLGPDGTWSKVETLFGRRHPPPAAGAGVGSGRSTRPVKVSARAGGQARSPAWVRVARPRRRRPRCRDPSLPVNGCSTPPTTTSTTCVSCATASRSGTAPATPTARARGRSSSRTVRQRSRAAWRDPSSRSTGRQVRCPRRSPRWSPAARGPGRSSPWPGCGPRGARSSSSTPAARPLAEVDDDEVEVLEEGTVVASFREVEVELSADAPSGRAPSHGGVAAVRGAGSLTRHRSWHGARAEGAAPARASTGAARPPRHRRGRDAQRVHLVSAQDDRARPGRARRRRPKGCTKPGSARAGCGRTCGRSVRCSIIRGPTCCATSWRGSRRRSVPCATPTCSLSVSRRPPPPFRPATTRWPTACCRARRRRSAARERLLRDVLGSDRYLRLLDALVDAAAEPRTTERAERRARDVVPGAGAPPVEEALTRGGRARRRSERRGAAPGPHPRQEGSVRCRRGHPGGRIRSEPPGRGARLAAGRAR